MQMRQRIILLGVLLLVLAAAGAGASTGEQMFRIEFTVYDNHTFTYLHADTANGSTYIPFNENDEFERYTIEFRAAEGDTVSSEEIYIPFVKGIYADEDDPAMQSTYVRLPTSVDATELRILHEGTEYATVSLVDEICSPEPDDVCNPFCGRHGADPDCEQSDNTLLLLIGLLLVIALGAAFLYYRRNQSDQSASQIRGGRRRAR